MGISEKSWAKFKRKFKVKEAQLRPIHSLAGKRNFRRLLRVDEDGSISERIYLEVSAPRHREHLICMHFLQHITKCFIKDFLGINLLKRDDPWDFRLELSTGQSFNLEITMIADSAKHFEIMKREEIFSWFRNEKKVPVRTLKKLFSIVPVTSDETELYPHSKSDDEIVENPFFGDGERLFLSALEKTEPPFECLVLEAIQKKEKKKHSDKDNTILIIDNRTNAYDLEQILIGLDRLGPSFESPFSEIWLYFGFYSNDDGNKAEFCFIPIKIPAEKEQKLRNLKNENEPDKYGRITV